MLFDFFQNTEFCNTTYAAAGVCQFMSEQLIDFRLGLTRQGPALEAQR